MKVLGIVAEYNPFHNGHAYQIKKAKEISGADYVLAIMSGSFVQRGEPALLDKWSRTKMALSAGCDMVIELPVVYACASAEFFAHAAVKLLEDSGIVNCLCFGSESGSIKAFESLGALLADESSYFSTLLNQELSKGLSFPAARESALKKAYTNELPSLNQPNNILGIEYCKALKKLKSSIEPFTLKREQAHYHSNLISGHIASATAIRETVKKNELHLLSEVIPKQSLPYLINTLEKGSAPVDNNHFSYMLQYCLRALSLNELRNISDISEGLENRILKACECCQTTNEMVQAIKSKRYTHTRIQRALLHALLHLNKSDFSLYQSNGYSQYIRVLGFRRQSQELLKKLCEQSHITVITNVKKAEKQLSPLAKQMLELELKATDIYFLGTPNVAFHKRNLDYTTPISII